MKQKQNFEDVWHSLSIKETMHLLDSNIDGLSKAEAKQRQDIYGLNTLPEDGGSHTWIIFLNQLKSPLVFVLILALVASLLLNHIIDAVIILIILGINTVFGWWQENKANQAMSRLKKIIVYHAKIIRSGDHLLLETKYLVPGDVVVLRAGDRVPADCRLIETENLQTSEAMLSGESLPLDKQTQKLAIGSVLAERNNMVYMGTNIVRGHGLGMVCATGQDTEIGKIGRLLVETKDEKTPLQKQLDKFSRFLTLVVGCISIIILIIGLQHNYGLQEALILASALAVSAIPEGLLVAVTIILALGMQKILKRKALVRKLIAAETLGSISVICTDKTGTLTEGKMQVFQFLTAESEFLKRSSKNDLEGDPLIKERVLLSKISLLCSNAEIENFDEPLDRLKIIGDPTESALLLASIESGFDKRELEKEYPRLSELPFDSEKKFMATLNHHKIDKHYHVFAKGAPEKIYAFCDQILVNGHKQKLTPQRLNSLKKRADKLAQNGLRVLAVAYKTGQHFDDLEKELSNLVLVGLIALKDPLRVEAKLAIQTCHQAGIRPIMITGDHPLTAQAIYKELGVKINGNILDGPGLDKLSDQELLEKVNHVDVYARVEPKHKLRIISALQKNGATVAMTGDGINDAPAIKGADIGIALGDGSDVTKEASDIVLLDNNFSTIVETIREGRVIYDNIKKVILYLLVDTFSEIIVIVGSLMLGLPLPLLAIQILWINLLNDGLPNLALSLEGEEDDVMSRPPRQRYESIFDTRLKIFLLAGFFTDILLIGVFYVMTTGGFDVTYARTLIFFVMALDSLLYAFSIKNLRRQIFESRPFTNKYLWLATGFSLVLLLLTIYTPQGNWLMHTKPLLWPEMFLGILLACLKVVCLETAKWFLIFKERYQKKYA